MSLSLSVAVERLGAPDALYNVGVTNGVKRATLSLDRMEDGQGLHVTLSADDAERIGKALLHAAENVRNGVHGSADKPSSDDVLTIQWLDGSEHTIPLGQIRTLSIPLGLKQRMEISPPRPLWYWNNSLGCEVTVLGGAISRAVFAPKMSNVIEVVAVPMPYATTEQ